MHNSPVCLVEGCYSTSRTKGLRLFHFPRTSETSAKWIEFTGSWTLMDYCEKRQLLGKKIGSHCKICSLHFRDEDFENEWKVRLKRGVIPSQNGPPAMEFMAKPEIADVSCTTPIPSSCRSTESPSDDRTFDIESGDLDDDLLPVGASKSPEKVVPTQLYSDTMRIACKTEIADVSCTTPIPSSSRSTESPSEDRSFDIESGDLDADQLPAGDLKSLEKVVPNQLDSNAMRIKSKNSFYLYCCMVEGCFSCSRSDGLKLFHFPSDKDRCAKWVEFTGSWRFIEYCEKRQLLGKNIGRHCRICSLHFRDEDFDNALKVRLRRGTVPSQNGPPAMEFMATPEIADVSCSTHVSTLS